MKSNDLKKVFIGFEECFSNKTKAEENNITFEIIKKENTKVCRIKTDNCLIQSKVEKKCDYVFFVNNEKIKEFYFVELKRPDDIKTAFEQIVCTINFFISKIEIKKTNIYAVIIINKILPRNLTLINRFKEEFRRKNGKAIYFETKKYSIEK